MKKASYLLIFIMAIVLYYPVFSAGYVWDDNLLFVEKVKLINQPLSWGLLTEPVLPDTTYFRPLVFLTIYVEFFLFGQSPLSSHVVNLVILIINSYLVSLIAYELLKFKNNTNALFLALLAGLIYVVNPVLVESTAWISGRFDLLVTTFSLLSIFTFLHIKKSTWVNSFGISMLFFLALLSKELGIILPFLIFMIYMYLNVNLEKSYFKTCQEFFQHYYKLIICIFITTLIYFILRVDAMGGMYHQELSSDYFNFAYVQNFMPIHSLFFYIKQFILPFTELTPLLPYENLNDKPYLVVFKFFTIIFLIAFIIWGLIKKNRYIWLVLSILLTVSLVIYIIPITIGNNIAHNRFMTLGAAIFAILMVVLPYQKGKKSIQKLAIIVVSIWLVSAAFVTKSIVPFWQSDFTLWKWNYTIQPENSFARNSYLYGLYQARQFDEVTKVLDDVRLHSPKGLTVSDQIMYVNTLISLNDPEALNYAKGVEFALPKFHVLYADKSDYQFSALTDIQIASFYGAYALATTIFEYNPKKSIELNNIAYWYLNEDEKVTYFYNDVAYLYLSENKQKAVELYSYLKTIDAYNKERYFYNLINMFNQFCLNQTKGDESFCEIKREEFLKDMGETI